MERKLALKFIRLVYTNYNICAVQYCLSLYRSDQISPSCGAFSLRQTDQKYFDKKSSWENILEQTCEAYRIWYCTIAEVKIVILQILFIKCKKKQTISTEMEKTCKNYRRTKRKFTWKTEHFLFIFLGLFLVSQLPETLFFKI